MGQHRNKLVFFWAYENWGGAQIYFMGLIKAAREEFDVSVYLPAGSGQLIDLIRSLGVETHLLDFSLDLSPARSFRHRILRQLRRLNAEVRSLRLLSKLNHAHAVIHIETVPWQSWLFFVALSVMGARVFLTFHNAPVPPSRYRELIWKARLAVVSRLPRIYFFAANRDTRERLKRLLPPTALERMIVTPASVDPDEIERAAQNVDRSSLRSELSIPDTDFVILSVGRFIDRKGRWVLLEAAREVVQAAPDCTFLWLTPDAPPIEDMRRVERYGLGEKFRVITSLQVASDRLAVLGFYKIADTFVLPSFLEGLPIALLEAMAMGLPVIATEIYAIPEAVSGGETGLLVMPGEASLLAEAVMRYKRDPSLRARMAEDGRRHVLANFRADETAAIAMDAYRRAFAHAG